MISQKTTIPLRYCYALLMAQIFAPTIRPIMAQEYQNWTLHAFDDGSTDSTLAILFEYQRKLGFSKFKIYEGPKRGYAKNFPLYVL